MDDLSKEAYWAGHDYLARCPKRAQQLGRALDQGRVRELEDVDGAGDFTAIVGTGTGYLVSFGFERGKWTGQCDCAEEHFCSHCYAAMMMRLEEQRKSTEAKRKSASGIAPTSSADPTGKKPPLKLAPFEQEISEKLERPLDRAEARIVRAIEKLWHDADADVGSVEGAWLQSVFGGSSSWSWEQHDIWAHKPATAWEAWLYLAYFLKGAKRGLPPFLRVLTTDRDIQEGVRSWHRDREVLAWTNWVDQHSAADLHRASPAVELRIMLTKDGLATQLREGAADWKAIKRQKWNEFSPERSGRASPLRDESLLLWTILHLGSGDEPVVEDLSDDGGVVARTLLQSVLLRSRVVTGAGEPYRHAEEKLRWAMRPAGTEEEDYHFELELPGSGSLPPAIWILDGNPVLYVTEDTIFEAPLFSAKSKREPARLTIPAPALETGAGVGVLEKAGVPLPPRIASRVQVRTPKLIAKCELSVERRTGAETFRLELLADWAKHAPRQSYRAGLWSIESWEQTDSPKGLEPEVDGAIIRWDDAALAQAAAIVDGLELKWDERGGKWERRVGKKFPELFGEWLQTLPPQLDLQLDPVLATLRLAPISASVRLDVEPAGVDWFDLRVALDLPEVEFTKEELKSLLSAEGGWVRLGEKGWRKLALQLTAEEDEILADLGLATHDLMSAEPQRLHTLQLAHPHAAGLLPQDRAAELRERASALQARVHPEVPAVITAELRPYQIEGFHFLAYLSTNRFGGLLADDMGLGKTLQALTWLAWLRAQPDFRGAPSLVVCPKSVMDNWQAEPARFAAGLLRVRRWSSGDAGKILAAVQECDLLVVNYAQLRGLAAELGSVKWHVIILDEAQAIKNPDSQTARMACALESEHRLALSGTPIENRLLDLWSIMQFAMPGMLGPRARFGKTYDQREDPLARRRLAGRVRPFVLRRTKEQVAKDLPERIEEDVLCDMEGKQATLYRAELKKAQQALLRLKTSRDLDQARFHILTSLLRLRQICCHPGLVDEQCADAPSAKVEGLIDLLEPLLEEGRKVLVFSQFVGVLEILQREMEARSWRYFLLTGQTEERGALIQSFQESEGPSVFLLSLKASGFGLNLTAASYVVLFDPWWNPAVENQAIDRTHRIGQTSTVFAYRLLVKGSIEEKIRALQMQKRALAADVLGEEAFARALTLDDLRVLLEDPA